MASEDPPPRPLPKVNPTPSLEEFVVALRALRRWAGLTLQQLELPTSTSHDYLRGRRLPAAEWLDAFVLRCLRHGKKRGLLSPDVDVYAELNRWRRAWSHLDSRPHDQSTAPAGASTSTEQTSDAVEHDVDETPSAETEPEEKSSAGDGWRMLRGAALAILSTIAAFTGARAGANQAAPPTTPAVPSPLPQPKVWTPTPIASYKPYDSRTRYASPPSSSSSTPQNPTRRKVWRYSDQINQNRD